MVYNLLTCAGWEAASKGWVAGGACIKGRLMVVVLFFIMAIVRKWGGEELGVEFNLIFAASGSILLHIILVTLTGNVKIAFVIALVGGLVLGYGSGLIFGDFGGGGDY